MVMGHGSPRYTSTVSTVGCSWSAVHSLLLRFTKVGGREFSGAQQTQKGRLLGPVEPRLYSTRLGVLDTPSILTQNTIIQNSTKQ